MTHKICNTILPSVSHGAQTLIWEVFFLSRRRGVDLETHFPWINQRVNTHCLTLSVEGSEAVIATLILRQFDVASIGRCAMVGMVCVDKAWRGQGLSSQLLSKALAYAAELHLASLVLWTGEPRIYNRQGFVEDKCDSFVQVTLNPFRPRAQVKFGIGHASSARGLPPFAQQLVCIESSLAQLITVRTRQGVALAEWHGELHAVLDLIEAALPASWGLNSSANDPIFEELCDRGHAYTSLMCAERMVRHLGTPFTVPYISVLDRI